MSTFEDTGGLSGNVHISYTNTTTNLGESPTIIIPAKVDVIPPKVSRTEFVSEGFEPQTSL